MQQSQLGHSRFQTNKPNKALKMGVLVGCQTNSGAVHLREERASDLEPNCSFFWTEPAAFRWLSSSLCALLRESFQGIFPLRSLTEVLQDASGHRAT